MCLSAAIARASEPATLLILPFENATEQSDKNVVAKGLPDLLTAFLSPESDRIRLVDRDQVDEIMAEGRLEREHLTVDQSAQKVGQLTAKPAIFCAAASQGRARR